MATSGIVNGLSFYTAMNHLYGSLNRVLILSHCVEKSILNVYKCNNFTSMYEHYKPVPFKVISLIIILPFECPYGHSPSLIWPSVCEYEPSPEFIIVWKKKYIKCIFKGTIFTSTYEHYKPVPFKVIYLIIHNLILFTVNNCL